MPMSDPTRQEMLDFLNGLPFPEDRSEFDVEEAIYWFAYGWHGGQTTNLYLTLSTSPFQPSPIARGPEETAMFLMEELEQEFKV